MRVVVLAAALLAAAAGPAAAQVDLSQSTASYSYFNRPGADLATHDRELLDCVGKAASAFPNTKLGAYRDFGVENCMVVKGWRVVRIPFEEGQALMKTPWFKVSSDFLASRVGAAAEPSLGIAREWNNDAADPDTIRGSLRPNYAGKPSISLRGLNPAVVSETDRANAFQTVYHMAEKSGKGVGDANPKKIAKLPAGSAIVVLRIKNPTADKGYGLLFERVLGDPPQAASLVDGQPARFGASQGTLDSRKEGRMAAFVVPPGRWRIRDMSVGQGLSFCLGSPSFEIKAGETVFAGTFDMLADPFAPDLDMADAKAFLSGAPAFAERMKPAEYRNGATGPCLYGVIYALEFKGAPFVEGYEWGGARKAP